MNIQPINSNNFRGYNARRIKGFIMNTNADGIYRRISQQLKIICISFFHVMPEGFFPNPIRQNITKCHNLGFAVFCISIRMNRTNSSASDNSDLDHDINSVFVDAIAKNMRQDLGGLAKNICCQTFTTPCLKKQFRTLDSRIFVVVY